jgi:hypothetical protein
MQVLIAFINADLKQVSDSGGKGWSVRKADLTAICEPIVFKI